MLRHNQSTHGRTTYNKAGCRLWNFIVQHTQNTPFYPLIYRSFWHCVASGRHSLGYSTCYYAARPNPGAGIGHQMANWIAGYWYARQFGPKFAHIPFSTPQWDAFLGIGEGEKTVAELRREGYKVRRLPRFDKDNAKEVELNYACEARRHHVRPYEFWT